MSTPQRVLQYTYGGDGVSGIDTYLLETYRALNHEAVQFDFVFRYGVPYSPDVVAELLSMGATVRSLDIEEHLPAWRRQVLEVIRFPAVLRALRPSILEINMTATFMCIAAAGLAALTGVRERIIHAHDAKPAESRFKRALKRSVTPVLNLLATERWACSSLAARYLYGDRIFSSGRWTLIKNSTSAERFRFNQEGRDRVRSEFSVPSNALLIGVVGRLSPQKNHALASAIIARLDSRVQPRALYVGSGELEHEVRRQISELNLNETVALAGRREDMADVFSALDVLLAPSLHEGFPIVAIEAQAAGLPLVVSPAFPPEADITGATKVVAIDAPITSWTDAIESHARKVRVGSPEIVTSSGYDSSSAALDVAGRYLRLAASIPSGGHS